MNPARLAEYRKVITALVGLGLTYASTYYATNHYVVLAIALAGVLGVYAVPNENPASRQLKTRFTASLAGMPLSSAPALPVQLPPDTGAEAGPVPGHL